MILGEENKITINNQELKSHSKASEKYVDVTFHFLNKEWSGWIPVEYRRTGLELKTDEEISEHIKLIYSIMEKIPTNEWLEEEEKYWEKEKPRATTTKEFFTKLSEGGWKCREHELPSNPNFARRIQDLKEFGYTLATNTHLYCESCGKNTTHLNLVPIPRIHIAGNGYETWSPKLKKRILKVLKNYDAYEGKKGSHLLPDHKFSEIRWDESTKEENPDTMTDEEIIAKFQLLTNQRNQHKREACRTCFQTNKRQYPFGINYFSDGTEDWDKEIPKKGKEAEKGCIGCGWYDLESWRRKLIEDISKNKN